MDNFLLDYPSQVFYVCHRLFQCVIYRRASGHCQVAASHWHQKRESRHHRIVLASIVIAFWMPSSDPLNYMQLYIDCNFLIQL